MRLVSPSCRCRVLSRVPVAVVVGSPGLYLGDRWQRQLRGSSQRSYLEREVVGAVGQREAVQWVVDGQTELCNCVGPAMTSVVAIEVGVGRGCMLRAMSLMVRWSRGKRERLG